MWMTGSVKNQSERRMGHAMRKHREVFFSLTTRGALGQNEKKKKTRKCNIVEETKKRTICVFKFWLNCQLASFEALLSPDKKNPSTIQRHREARSLVCVLSYKKTSQAKPSQAKPSQAKPSQAKPSQAKPSQAKPSQAKPSQAKPSQAKPSQAKPSQAKPLSAVIPQAILHTSSQEEHWKNNNKLATKPVKSSRETSHTQLSLTSHPQVPPHRKREEQSLTADITRPSHTPVRSLHTGLVE